MAKKGAVSPPSRARGMSKCGVAPRSPTSAHFFSSVYGASTWVSTTMARECSRRAAASRPSAAPEPSALHAGAPAVRTAHEINPPASQRLIFPPPGTGDSRTPACYHPSHPAIRRGFTRCSRRGTSMDFDLTPGLLALQERARRFTEDELYPHEMTVEETEALPDEVSERLRRRAIELGLWAMNVPKELGGLGSSVLEQVIAQEQAGRATNDLWGYVGGPYNALLRGNEAQRLRYLDPAVRGTATAAIAYAITEPGGGSDTSGLRTTAVRKG